MDTYNIKKLLKDGYENAGFDVISELETGETLLRYPEPGAVDVTLKLLENDVTEFAQLYAARRQFRSRPTRTSLIGRHFREHLLLPAANVDERDLQDVLAKQSQRGIYVEIGDASPVFCNFFRFDPGYMNLCIDQLYSLPQRVREATAREPLDVRHIFARPLTIRVFNLRAESLQEALAVSDEWIERTLFMMAYEYGVSLMLADDWMPARAQRVRMHQPGQISTLLSSGGRFRADLVKLYQAGTAAVLPAHRFLAWFRILELLFQEVDHSGAYDRLHNLLNEPEFAADPAVMARIVQIVESSRKEIAPQQRLVQMLQQHRSCIPAGQDADTLAQHLLAIRDEIIHSGTAAPSDDSINAQLGLLKCLAAAAVLATRES